MRTPCTRCSRVKSAPPRTPPSLFFNDLAMAASLRASAPDLMAFAEGVVRDVMRYFLQHPTAADTAEGIARWRLLEQRARDAVAETDAALELLVARKIVKEIRVAGAPTLFRLN